MRKERPGLRAKIEHLAEGLAANAVYGLFAALPVDVASAVGGWLFRRIGPRLRHTRRARRNLEMVFPEKSPAEIDSIIGAMWENLGRTAAEFPHLRAFEATGPGTRVELVGEDILSAVMAGGGPVLFFTAHLANWEVLIRVAARRGVDVHATYREANNPAVERIYRRARGGRYGGNWLAKGPRGARRLVDVLKAGGAVAMLVDQKMNDGIPVPFFGRPAMTASALAQLAFKYGCPVVPVRAVRTGGARFRVEILPPLEMPAGDDRRADVVRLMTEVNRIIEQWVREHPEQWLWLHRRWG